MEKINEHDMVRIKSSNLIGVVVHKVGTSCEVEFRDSKNKIYVETMSIENLEKII